MSVLGVTFSKDGLMIDDVTGKPYRHKPEFKVHKLSDFLDISFPPPTYIVDPWLPSRGIVMIYAPRGLGKTWFALDLALSAASGTDFLGYWSVPDAHKVLYLDGEMDGTELQERLKKLCMARGVSKNAALTVMPLATQPDHMPMLDDNEHQEAMDTACRDVGLIIIDNLSSLTRMPENEGESWIPVQQWALRMRAQGKTVVFVHHAGKSGAQRGTSRREDVLNTVVALRRVEEDDEQDGAVFNIVFEKTRGFNGQDARTRRAELLKDENGLPVWDIQDAKESETKAVVDKVMAGLTYREVAADMGVSIGAVAGKIKQAVQDGFIDESDVPKRGGKAR